MAIDASGNNIGHSKPSTASVRPIEDMEGGQIDMLDQETFPKQISRGHGNAGIPFNARWNRKVPPGEPAFQIPINGG